MDPYNHSTPISIKLPILDTRKFKQWKFRIQQYLQYEHYALWEVIKFGDSYKAPPEETTKDKGLAGEDMHKRKNDVKETTTLLLALLDEYQFRLSKYDSAKELWEAILKTFGGNEATKKTKKNQLKQQYGNFKAERSETLKQTFNSTDVAAASLSYDTIYAYIATQPNGSQIKYEDISQIDDDDIEEMDIKWNLALLIMRADRSPKSQDIGKRESYKKDPKVEEIAPKAMIAIDGTGWDWSYMVEEDEDSKNHALEVKKEKESIDFKIENFENASKDLDRLLESQKLDKDKKGMGFNEYCVVSPLPAQVYSPSKKDLSWMGLPEFVDDTVTGYTRPTPSIYVSKSASKEQEERWKSNNPSFFEHGGSSGNVVSKPLIKFVKESGCPNATNVNNTKNARKPTVKYAKMYKNTSQSPKVEKTKGIGKSKIPTTRKRLYDVK
nr:hypothetical protein [Tanacetum cinerariifolium]